MKPLELFAEALNAGPLQSGAVGKNAHGQSLTGEAVESNAVPLVRAQLNAVERKSLWERKSRIA